MKYPVRYRWQGDATSQLSSTSSPIPSQNCLLMSSSPQDNRSPTSSRRPYRYRDCPGRRLHDQALRKLIANEESRRIAQEREIEQAEHDSTWFGFTNNLPALKKNRSLAILGKHMPLNDGAVEERGNVVAFLVQQGRHIERRPDGIRYLISDDGSYLSEKNLTKVGMDFAEYLLQR